jgi:hypothetical protein
MKEQQNLRVEVYKWLDADRAAGGLGAKISASLLERTRKRTGAERFLGTDTRAKQQIAKAREHAINEYVANGISLRGPVQKLELRECPALRPRQQALRHLIVTGGLLVV